MWCLGFFSQEFELRKHARQEGRRYCDPVVLTYQAERMPEQIRLKVRILTELCSDAELLPLLIMKIDGAASAEQSWILLVLSNSATAISLISHGNT